MNESKLNNFDKDNIENVLTSLQNPLIKKAIYKNIIDQEDLLSITPLGLEAIVYPSVNQCLSCYLSSFSFLFPKLLIKEILQIKTKKDLLDVVKKCRKKIKKNIFLRFLVPIEIHDEIHQREIEMLFKNPKIA